MQKRIKNIFFNFKQFTIIQEKTAMKVGIDGVLLGAWANVSNSGSILDIGTGTGLLALMCAQKNKTTTIDAIEVNTDAFNEALNNVNNSPWSNRISIKNIDFQSFTENKKYNHIISNPPFYTENSHSPDIGRNIARNANNLPLDFLLKKASEYLSENGKISLIYSSQNLDLLKKNVSNNNLNISNICYVYPSLHKTCHRVMVEINNYKKSETIETSLYIRNEKSEYTTEYKDLTKDFYINHNH